MAMDMGWLERDRPRKFDKKHVHPLLIRLGPLSCEFWGGIPDLGDIPIRIIRPVLPWHNIAQYIPIGKIVP